MAKATIKIFGMIGDDSWEGARAWGVIGTNYIIEQLENLDDDVDEIDLLINTVGGDVIEGWGIYDAMILSGYKLNTIIQGQAASMGSIVSLVAKKENRKATSNSTVFIHNPWGMIGGNADEVLQYGEYLRQVETDMTNFYNEKTGHDIDDLKEAMNKETRLSAKKAKEWGFIGEILSSTEEIEDQQAEARKINAKAKKFMAKQKDGYTVKDIQNSFAQMKQRKEIENMTTKKKLTAIQRLANARAAVMGKELPHAQSEEGNATALNVTGADGTPYIIETEETEAAEGDIMTDEDGNTVDAGTIELDSGDKITTDEDGVITSIEEGEEEEEEEASAELDEVKETVGALAKRLKSLEKDNVAMKKTNKELTVALKGIEEVNEDLVSTLEAVAKSAEGKGFRPSESGAANFSAGNKSESAKSENAKAVEDYRAERKARQKKKEKTATEA